MRGINDKWSRGGGGRRYFIEKNVLRNERRFQIYSFSFVCFLLPCPDAFPFFDPPPSSAGKSFAPRFACLAFCAPPPGPNPLTRSFGFAVPSFPFDDWGFRP